MHLSHKRTLWIEEPEYKHSERKACRRTQKKGQKRPKGTKVQLAWEWGTNEYFCSPCVLILWRLSWKLPKDKVKMNSTYLSLERVILTLRFWFPFPNKIGLSSMITDMMGIQTSRRIQHLGSTAK